MCLDRNNSMPIWAALLYPYGDNSVVVYAGNLHLVPTVDPEIHELDTSAWTYGHYPVSNV